MKSAVIFGANSSIAEQVIYKLAQNGYNLYLLARNISDLERINNDLKVRFQNIEIFIESYDASQEKGQIIDKKLELIYSKMPNIDLFLFAHGVLPEQQKAEQDWNYALNTIEVNSLSIMEVCNKIAIKVENTALNTNTNIKNRSITIAVISSVAGLRGRQSNYIYGAAKGMLNVFLSGLRNRLHKYNVQVLTILPGFVDTKMTKDIVKKGALWATPQDVANDVMKAIVRKKDILYTKWFWKYVMLIIMCIPEKMFKKLKL
jgi:decaprenylphospho-beta-D-erythro-pentofuranosid-2-ulose 2-reductase